jgi:hypothetical protein
MIILKVIMDINLPFAVGAGCSKEAEAGLPGGGPEYDHLLVHHGHQS